MAMEIFTVGRGQEGYPERLMPFADMPSRLFVRGALPADEQKTAAIVGARICTAYGKSQAAFFAQVLAANGVAVISGLACGIDAAAHEGALRGKGKTFAVLGCGVDICYPRENIRLYMQHIVWLYWSSLFYLISAAHTAAVVLQFWQRCAFARKEEAKELKIALNFWQLNLVEQFRYHIF